MWKFWEFLEWPARASTAAASVDAYFNFLNAVTIFFSLLVALLIVFLAVRYRRGNQVDRSNAPAEGVILEATWTIIPTIIVTIMFVWATVVWFSNMVVPADATPIYVVGKQWMWKLQHPEGRWEMNELHVPVGRPIKLIMTSEDVLHDFYVPAFRVKQDVVPGRYTELWFEATEVGEFHLFCAEYCGTKHSGMVGTVYVMEPAEYEKWLRTGNVENTMAARGERLFRDLGCSGCHGAASSVRAPSLDGIYNRPVAVEVPGGGTRTVIADERYIHDSIVLPETEIAAGYKPIMPTYKNRVSEEDLLQLLEYIKSLGTRSGPGNMNTREYMPTNNQSAERNENVPLASPESSARTNSNTPLASPAGQSVR